MEEEIFVANSKGEVKALGMKVNCAPTELHIYVNGVDITKNVVLEEVRIVIAKEQQAPVVLISPPQQGQQGK
jgi:hypothetical protein